MEANKSFPIPSHSKNEFNWATKPRQNSGRTVAELRKVLPFKTIASILHSINPTLVCVDYDIEKTTNAGDNYMSEVASLIIYVQEPGRVPNVNNNLIQRPAVSMPVFFKIIPSEESTRKMLVECLAFVKETAMYRQVFPDLGEYFQELIPKCHFTFSDEGCNDFLALEDVRVSGYKMPDRREGLDIPHCTLALQTLAKFHALSFVAYRRDFETIITKYPFLTDHERIFVAQDKVTEFHLAYVGQTGVSYSTALNSAGYPREAEILSNLFQCPRKILEKLHELISLETCCPVIGHGNYWMNNLLYKYNSQHQPISMKFVDFQMVRVGSRTLDLHLLLQTSLAFDLTDSLEHQLLYTYHNAFKRNATQLGFYEPQLLTFEQLKLEYETFRYFGIYAGLFYLQFVHARREDIRKISSIQGNNCNDIMYQFFSGLINSKTIQRVVKVVRTQLPKLKVP